MEDFIGFGLSGYRSFSGPVQRIAPFGKVTLLAGANNSGKSNVLSFVAEHLAKLTEKLRRRQSYAVSGLDIPQGATSSAFVYSIPIPTDSDSLNKLAEEMLQGRSQQAAPAYLGGLLSKILAVDAIPKSPGLSWLDIRPAIGGDKLALDQAVVGALAAMGTDGKTSQGPAPREWEKIWQVLTHQTGGGLASHWVPETLNAIAFGALICPPIEIVPAFRQISAGTPDKYELSGNGLYTMLARLQNPSLAEQPNKRKFQSIIEFVRQVTQVSDATLEVPFNRDTLHVHLRGRLLPITHLGTGLHQVILLASAATLFDKTLICLEEPELHLHPLLQRELLRYLERHTTNQYLISTHSAHFLDTPNAAVFHVRPISGWTEVQSVKEPTERFDVCRTLGYHASDLLQANAVIWVEGPSDRVYLLEWLRQVAPELQEGYQFSIMFYGGRLLSNLTGAEEEVSDFIHLRRLNRNFAVIMDSDKKSPGSAVLETKTRIARELNGGGGVAWITKVRTIENYVPLQAWRSAVAEVHPKSTPAWDGRAFSNPFDGLPGSPNKVRLAEAVCKAGLLDIARYDVAEKVDALVAMIKQANPPAVVSRGQ